MPQVKTLKMAFPSSAICSVVIGLFGGLLASVASGGEITVTFDETPLGGPQFGVGSNFFDSGFRFSPCHNYGIVDSTHLGLWSYLEEREPKGFNDSQFFVFQAGNGPGNPEYLGLSPGCGSPRDLVGSGLYIDFGGNPFSFVSFFGPMFDGLTITSSNGGIFGTGMGNNPQPGTFAGAEWTDVRWINFSTGGADIPIGLDQLTFRVDVPEPGTFWLVGFALIGLGITRKRVGLLTRG
jgi:hypothetical protein